jgi:hypothetical protein
MKVMVYLGGINIYIMIYEQMLKKHKLMSTTSITSETVNMNSDPLKFYVIEVSRIDILKIKITYHGN